jgi:hypothetical protein
MGANELSAELWRERELLELMLFKLEEEQLLLMAGKSRWIAHATREVEQVLERLRQLGLSRSVHAEQVAAEWGAPADAGLRQLVEHAPDGVWQEVFTAHLTAMTELTDEIAALRDANERLLRQALRSTQDTLGGLRPDAATYDAQGTPNGQDEATIVDRTM